jgi:hypothetical protein
MRIVLDLDSDASRIAGTLTADPRNDGCAFDGWLELMRMLERILAEQSDASPRQASNPTRQFGVASELPNDAP